MKAIFRNTWVVGVGTLLIGSLVLYFIFGIGKNVPTIETNAPTIGSILTVGQTGGTNAITNNINQEAKYVWVNEKTWKAEAGDGMAAGTYQVNLLFVAAGSVFPVSPCLYIHSDAALKSVGPIGTSAEWAKGKTSQGGLANSVTFQAMFDSRPVKLEAALVQEDQGLELKHRAESQFMIPVVN